MTNNQSQPAGEKELKQELKEFDLYFDHLYITYNVMKTKDAGHAWIEFSDKWNAFKKKLLSPSTPNQSDELQEARKSISEASRWVPETEEDYKEAVAESRRELPQRPIKKPADELGRGQQIVVTATQVNDAIKSFSEMAIRAKNILDNLTVKTTPFLTENFTEWMHKCEARAQVLKWVVGIDYLKDDKPNHNL